MKAKKRIQKSGVRRRKRLAFPKVEELWMFWSTERNDWMVAVDDPRRYNAYLCATSEAAAKAVQQHQLEAYGLETIPVRIL